MRGFAVGASLAKVDGAGVAGTAGGRGPGAIASDAGADSGRIGAAGAAGTAAAGRCSVGGGVAMVGADAAAIGATSRGATGGATGAGVCATGVTTGAATTGAGAWATGAGTGGASTGSVSVAEDFFFPLDATGSSGWTSRMRPSRSARRRARSAWAPSMPEEWLFTPMPNTAARSSISLLVSPSSRASSCTRIFAAKWCSVLVYVRGAGWATRWLGHNANNNGSRWPSRKSAARTCSHPKGRGESVDPGSDPRIRSANHLPEWASLRQRAPRTAPGRRKPTQTDATEANRRKPTQPTQTDADPQTDADSGARCSGGRSPVVARAFHQLLPRVEWPVDHSRQVRGGPISGCGTNQGATNSAPRCNQLGIKVQPTRHQGATNSAIGGDFGAKSGELVASDARVGCFTATSWLRWSHFPTQYRSVQSCHDGRPDRKPLLDPVG